MTAIFDIIEQNSAIIMIGMALLIIVLIIITIVNIAKCSSLKKKYNAFMQGKDGKSLEDDLIFRLEQIDELVESNAANERNIDLLFKKMGITFQKYGIIKYDAFDELGGKLSFTLAMLNERNDGYILNVVHSREGCFSYVKEIIAGNPILALSPEEQEALEDALSKE
ncbi:MAG: DUF4446 family protein [Lachnospiraceae bacterium]|nr:DUF4446 family protein [Lachnospiraceae bacterium]